LDTFVQANEAALGLGFFFGVIVVMALWKVLAPRRALSVSKAARRMNSKENVGYPTCPSEGRRKCPPHQVRHNHSTGTLCLVNCQKGGGQLAPPSTRYRGGRFTESNENATNPRSGA
jgi:hypothetical protein